MVLRLSAVGAPHLVGLLREECAAKVTGSEGREKMKNRSNSGLKTETKFNVFSVHCLGLSIQKMVQEELSRFGSKTGVGST